ncbi:MAG: hypothetical protein ACJAR2_002976 [Ilumatobacter sp.]|jgi:hypothetical protein
MSRTLLHTYARILHSDDLTQGGIMFGKTKELSEIDDRLEGDVTVDDFFGDEAAVAETVRVDHLHERVNQVEQQISSQFTSLAAYAQIAQEQVELVRSEAQHTNERSEQRVIELIERERFDRQAESPGGGIDVTARLDALDAHVEEIRTGLQQCLSNQKALANAITDLFTPISDHPAGTPAPPPLKAPVDGIDDTAELERPPTDASPNQSFPPPRLSSGGSITPYEMPATGLIDGPIFGLSLD